MHIPIGYWPHITNAIAQVAKQVDQGLCIRPKPNAVPLKFCSRKAVEGSKCCARHQEDCPTK